MSGLILYLKTLLEGNIVASGGLFVMIAGFIMGIVYKIFPLTFAFLKRRFIVTLDITSADETFDWFNKWLSTIDYSKNTKLLTVSSRSSGKDNKKPELFFSPAPGNHIFFYKGRVIWINRNREKSIGTEKGFINIYEQFTVIMLGRNKEILKDLIKDARDYCYNLELDKVKIYVNSNWEWSKIQCQNPRKLKTVILKNNLQYEIKKDIKEFFKKEEWYRDMGIPYRRGYLLHGCPGTGKTSLVKALAGEFEIPIYILNISKDTTENQFLSLISNVPEKSIIVIEDIDCLFNSKRKMNKGYGINFKTLLNAIDGIVSPYGTLLFLTTNHKLKLDSALIRPGRIDREYHIGKVNKKQAIDLFKLFYPSSNGCAEKFGRNIESNKYTPADLQKYFINRPDINIAIKEINKIKEK